MPGSSGSFPIMPQLPEAVNRTRAAFAALLDGGGRGQAGPEGMLAEDQLALVACSGGADSLALAAAAAHFVRRGQARAGGVVVDHQLHPDSAEIAATAARQLRDLGLDPVISLTADVDPSSPDGPEAAARAARYRAFGQALAQTGAAHILLAHTRDDQAEQVLLGLARGSGTRSLAGIPARRGPFLRPLLGISREETEAVCTHEGLNWWEDPANADPKFLRSRIRAEILPTLEQRLSGSIRESLARTAQIAAEDARYLEDQAKEVFSRLLEDPDEQGNLRLDLERLAAEPPALRRRVIALAVVAVGGSNPSSERIAAVEQLLARQGSAGPVELEGHVTARRGTRDTPDYGKLVLGVRR